MSQTAVDYLIEQFKDHDFSIKGDVYLIKIPHWRFEEIIGEARTMIEEQIKDAYADGLNAHRTDFCDRDEYFTKSYGEQP